MYTPKRHIPTPGQRGHSPQRHTAAGSAAPTTIDTGNAVPRRANPLKRPMLTIPPRRHVSCAGGSPLLGHFFRGLTARVIATTPPHRLLRITIPPLHVEYAERRINDGILFIFSGLTPKKGGLGPRCTKLLRTKSQALERERG